MGRDFVMWFLTHVFHFFPLFLLGGTGGGVLGLGSWIGRGSDAYSQRASNTDTSFKQGWERVERTTSAFFLVSLHNLPFTGFPSFQVMSCVTRARRDAPRILCELL